MDKKYELVTYESSFYRIRALRDFADVARGELGGFVESEANLSHLGDCWVYNNAQVYGKAQVSDYAKIYGKAKIYGNAIICDYAVICDDAIISSDAIISDRAVVSGDAQVSQALIYAGRSDGHTFAIAQSPTKGLAIMVGYRFFSIDEAREHWRQTCGDTKLGRESIALVDHLVRMAEITGLTPPCTADQSVAKRKRIMGEK